MPRVALQVKVFTDPDEKTINKWLTDHPDIEVKEASLAGAASDGDTFGWRYVLLYQPLRPRQPGRLSQPSTSYESL